MTSQAHGGTVSGINLDMITDIIIGKGWWASHTHPGIHANRSPACERCRIDVLAMLNIAVPLILDQRRRLTRLDPP